MVASLVKIQSIRSSRAAGKLAVFQLIPENHVQVDLGNRDFDSKAGS